MVDQTELLRRAAHRFRLGPRAIGLGLRLEKPVNLIGRKRFVPALVQQFRPRRTMDRAIDAAAAEQGAVRRVDDRVDGQGGDVAVDDRELHAGDRHRGSER